MKIIATRILLRKASNVSHRLAGFKSFRGEELRIVAIKEGRSIIIRDLIVNIKSAYLIGHITVDIPENDGTLPIRIDRFCRRKFNVVAKTTAAIKFRGSIRRRIKGGIGHPHVHAFMLMPPMIQSPILPAFRNRKRRIRNRSVRRIGLGDIRSQHLASCKKQEKRSKKSETKAEERMKF